MEHGTDELLTVSQAAVALGITPDRVRQLDREGLLRPACRPGGIRLFRRADVVALAALRECRAQGLAPESGV